MAELPPMLSSAEPMLDYQGQPEDRVWIMREAVLEEEVKALRAEVAFLREMLRAALTPNTERSPE